jgi:hypothetical protein
VRRVADNVPQLESEMNAADPPTDTLARVSSRRDAMACALVLAAWALAACVAHVGGEYAQNDDFAYSLSVRWLLDRGEFLRTPWTYVPSLSNVLWGAAFAALADSFFEALRTSTLLAGALGVLGCYALARQAGANERLAACAALATGFNPVYFSLSASFMTDVHFTLWLVWGTVFLGEAYRAPRASMAALGAFCAIAGTLTRQSGLALPAAFGLASVIAHPRSRAHWLQGIAVSAAVLGAYAIFQNTAATSIDVFNPRVVAWHFRENSPAFQAAKHSVISAIYLGAFSLPLVPLLLGRARKGVLAALGGAGLLLAAVTLLELPMPPGINVLRNLGIGPLDLAGSPQLPTAPNAVWWAWSFAGGAAGLWLLGALLAHARDAIRERSLAVFWALAAGLHLALYVVRAPFFDRYLITVLPMWLAALVAVLATRAEAKPATRTAWITASALLAASALFSVLATHDQLARHRAVWALADREIASGVAPERINAGFPYRGWHFMKDQKREIGRPKDWLTETDRHIEVGAPTGDADELAYRRWLPPGDEAVRVVAGSAVER